jgi:hypothetical protein
VVELTDGSEGGIGGRGGSKLYDRENALFFFINQSILSGGQLLHGRWYLL